VPAERPAAAPADRYGRGDSPARRRRANVVGAVVAGLATVAVVAYWASSSLGAGSSTDAQLVNFAVRDASLVSVNFTVTTNPGAALACAVQAQNDQYLVVGWQVVDVPASAQHTQQISTDVRTTQAATSIVLKECWAV